VNKAGRRQLKQRNLKKGKGKNLKKHPLEAAWQRGGKNKLKKNVETKKEKSAEVGAKAQYKRQKKQSKGRAMEGDKPERGRSSKSTNES